MGFLEDIGLQGAALRTLTQHHRRSQSILGLDLATVLPDRIRSILITGMGTSLHAAAAVQHRLSARAQAPVLVMDAAELLHFGLNSVTTDDVVIAVSQSGESVETLSVVEALDGHPHLITVTNNPGSPMAALARLNLDMLAGQEAAISTKTYTNALALLLLLGRAIARESLQPLVDGLDEVSREMDSAARSDRRDIERAASLFREASSLYFISRGPALAAAAQAALTFQEGVRIPAVWMSGGAFRHGPMELAGEGHYATIFAPNGAAGDLLRGLTEELARMGSRGALFTSVAVHPLDGFMQVRLTAGTPELFALAAAVPQELLLDQMARDRGRIAGVFERGEKITRRE